MQKIILKASPSYSFNSIASTLLYLGTLSAVTYVCYLYMSSLVILQALLNWMLIYLFFLILAILFIYLILLWAKDVLLRESHIYLSDELTCDALKHDVKTYVQSLVQKSKYALYLASSLYFIFTILIFSVIFRLDFAYQFSKIFGLDYFFEIVSAP